MKTGYFIGTLVSPFAVVGQSDSVLARDARPVRPFLEVLKDDILEDLEPEQVRNDVLLLVASHPHTYEASSSCSCRFDPAMSEHSYDSVTQNGY